MHLPTDSTLLRIFVGESDRHGDGDGWQPSDDL